MKRTWTLVSVLSLAALITGCEPMTQTPQADSEPTDAAAERYEEATKEIVEAADAAGSYAKAQKTVFMTQMEERVAALKSEVEDMQAQIADTTDEIKAEGEKKLEALKQQAEQLGRQLDEVGNAAESNGEEVKTGFESAYEETRKAFDDARAWLSEQIAPDQS
jgi:TolA-binding protein